MKTVNLTVAESDVPFVLNAIRTYANSLMTHLHVQTVDVPPPPTEATVTISPPATGRVSKNGKRIGRPPKGAK